MSSHAFWVNAAKETPRFCRVLACLSRSKLDKTWSSVYSAAVCLCRPSVPVVCADNCRTGTHSTASLGWNTFFFMPPQNGRCKESGDILLKTLSPFREQNGSVGGMRPCSCFVRGGIHHEHRYLELTLVTPNWLISLAVP